ncbi:MAG: HyaD/HybD family hydrogenase maturation endopeptidase [Bacillota bacterium]
MSGEKDSTRILVLGVGNMLLKDEGIGVHVVKAMAGRKLPENVTLHEGHVAGIDLLDIIQQADRLIIVDSVDAGAEAGAVFRFQPHEVECLLRDHKTSLHQVDLMETLKIARFCGRCPETVIIGVQPKAIAWGLELTPELEDRVPFVIGIVEQELGLLGA